MTFAHSPRNSRLKWESISFLSNWHNHHYFATELEQAFPQPKAKAKSDPNGSYWHFETEFYFAEEMSKKHCYRQDYNSGPNWLSKWWIDLQKLLFGSKCSFCSFPNCLDLMKARQRVWDVWHWGLRFEGFGLGSALWKWWIRMDIGQVCSVAVVGIELCNNVWLMNSVHMNKVVIFWPDEERIRRLEGCLRRKSLIKLYKPRKKIKFALFIDMYSCD